MFARHWLVCDMDGTITSTPTKAGGEYLSLSHSPCYEPLRRYLANGGNLCVVSTAGRRMWRQIFNEVSDVIFSPSATGKALSATTPGRLAICGFSGAALFLSDPATKSMTEVMPFRETALKYTQGETHRQPHTTETGHGHHYTEATTIDLCNQESIINLAIDRVRTFINAAGDEMLALKDKVAVAEPSFVSPLVGLLSTKYHGPYMDLVRTRNDYLAKALAKREVTTSAGIVSDDTTGLVAATEGTAPTPSSSATYTASNDSSLLKDFYDEVLNKQRLTTHGSFIVKTHDALVDLQTIPETSPPVGIQVTVMGIPMSLYDTFFTPSIIAELAEYGVFAKAQPNSVAIAKKGIDKALCVQWLRDHVPDFALERALAFGDIPVSVDKPLTLYPPMKFISLSTTPSTDPVIPDGNGVFVGNEEVGAAAFLEAMLGDVLSESESSVEVPENLFTPDRVQRWADAAVATKL